MKDNGNTKTYFKRIIAYLLDGILIFLISLSAAILSMQIIGGENARPISIFIFILAYGILYFFIDNIGKASVFKKLFGLKIIDKKTGNTASFGTRLLRNMCTLIPINPIYFLIKKQSIGDSFLGVEVTSR